MGTGSLTSPVPADACLGANAGGAELASAGCRGSVTANERQSQGRRDCFTDMRGPTRDASAGKPGVRNRPATAGWAERWARFMAEPPALSRHPGVATRTARSVPCKGDLTVAKGIIRRLVEYRGFGFIQSDDGRSVFFHRSAVRYVSFGELQEGQAVEFEIEDTPQGPKARHVCVIKGDSTSQGDNQ
jgi:cold shock protein